MNHHLVVTFYFRPDLCAGSFRNTAFVQALKAKIPASDRITVFTTMPNRYSTHRVGAPKVEVDGNVSIFRFEIPAHASGFKDQIQSFWAFYRQSSAAAKDMRFTSVFASSSRLFTAYLGSRISRRQRIPLFLDMRDLFRENICEIMGNPFVRWPLDAFLRVVEHRTFGRASHINLVSEGFADDFGRFGKPLSFFPNGIDDEFLDIQPEGLQSIDGRRIVTYAGNMGEGQGLDRIIPDAAKALENHYIFHLYGDGGTRKRLTTRIEELNLTNVILHDPVSREALVDVYRKSDVLFVHLNRLQAFEKALPSKFFEYGAIGLPIVAGVAGYARRFVQENLPDAVVFDPCDARQLVESLMSLGNPIIDRSVFIRKFKRQNIMADLADLYLKSISTSV